MSRWPHTGHPIPHCHCYWSRVNLHVPGIHRFKWPLRSTTNNNWSYTLIDVLIVTRSKYLTRGRSMIRGCRGMEDENLGYWPICRICQATNHHVSVLTHWCRDKMAVILHQAFSNTFFTVTGINELLSHLCMYRLAEYNAVLIKIGFKGIFTPWTLSDGMWLTSQHPTAAFQPMSNKRLYSTCYRIWNCFVMLWFVVVMLPVRSEFTWRIDLCSSRLLHWHWDKHNTCIPPVPVKQSLPRSVQLTDNKAQQNTTGARLTKT